MAGFLFIRSTKHADIASKIVGALVAAVSLVATARVWGTSPSAIVLVPLCFVAIGYKIFRRHSRTLALALAVLLASLGITLYLNDPSNPSMIVICLSCGVACYGFAATVAYRRLDRDNPHGFTHLELLQKIKTILSVAINTSGCPFLALGIFSWQITGAWINGVSKGRSWWYGMTRGCILGLLSIALVWIITGNFSETRQNPNFWVHLRSLAGGKGEPMSAAPLDAGVPGGLRRPSSEWLALAAANAAIWGLFGLFGGLAIYFKRVAGGILLALLLAATLVEGTLVLFRLPIGDLVRFGVAQLCLVTGWVLGIVLYPPARCLLPGNGVTPTHDWRCWRSSWV